MVVENSNMINEREVVKYMAKSVASDVRNVSRRFYEFLKGVKRYPRGWTHLDDMLITIGINIAGTDIAMLIEQVLGVDNKIIGYTAAVGAIGGILLPPITGSICEYLRSKQQEAIEVYS